MRFTSFQQLADSRRQEHAVIVARIAEAALRARTRAVPAVPKQRTGPARDARGRFLPKVSA